MGLRWLVFQERGVSQRRQDTTAARTADTYESLYGHTKIQAARLQSASNNECLASQYLHFLYVVSSILYSSDG